MDNQEIKEQLKKPSMSLNQIIKWFNLLSEEEKKEVRKQLKQ